MDLRNIMKKMYGAIAIPGSIATVLCFCGMFIANELGNDQGAVILFGISAVFVITTLTALAMDYNKMPQNVFVLCISMFALWYVTTANVIIFDAGEISGLFANSYHGLIFAAKILMLCLLITTIYNAYDECFLQQS